MDSLPSDSIEVCIYSDPRIRTCSCILLSRVTELVQKWTDKYIWNVQELRFKIWNDKESVTENINKQYACWNCMSGMCTVGQNDLFDKEKRNEEEWSNENRNGNKNSGNERKRNDDRFDWSMNQRVDSVMSITDTLPCIRAVCYVGDNVEDEWMIVWMMRELSMVLRNVAVAVRDSDGQFLLIEV